MKGGFAKITGKEGRKAAKEAHKARFVRV